MKNAKCVDAVVAFPIPSDVSCIMKRYEDDFPRKLAGFDLATLEAEPDSVFGLSRDLRLNYLNPGWFRFARENNGEPAISQRFPIGTPIELGITQPLRSFYLNVYKRIIARNEVWQHDYECSTPDKFRVFHQTIYPLTNRSGVVIINSLTIQTSQRAAGRTAAQADREAYEDANGFITQCSHCRRFMNPDHDRKWDWIPAWVLRMPERTSHSLCPECFDYYYKHRARRRQAG